VKTLGKKLTLDQIKVNSKLPFFEFQLEMRSRMSRVKRIGCDIVPGQGARRDVVKTLSVSSGLRLQQTVCSVNPEHGLPYWICLTYPKDYPGSWQVWKVHLNNFQRQVLNVWGKHFIGAVWRLEAQRRGAPHYHLMLWLKLSDDHQTQVGFREWIADTWFKIVGSEDPKHLKAGTSCELLKDDSALQGVVGYVGKYLGKDSVHPDSQVFKSPVGRYWGVWNKKRLLSEPEKVKISKEEYLKLRRVFLKYRAKGKKKSARGKENLNSCTQKQLGAPGLRCFLKKSTVEKLYQVTETIPF
jgi:hypothetical protein